MIYSKVVELNEETARWAGYRLAAVAKENSDGSLFVSGDPGLTDYKFVDAGAYSVVVERSK